MYKYKVSKITERYSDGFVFVELDLGFGKTKELRIQPLGVAEILAKKAAGPVLIDYMRFLLENSEEVIVEINEERDDIGDFTIDGRKLTNILLDMTLI